MTRNSFASLGLATLAALSLAANGAYAQTVSAAKAVDTSAAAATPSASVTNAVVTEIIGTPSTTETFLIQDSTGALEVYKLSTTSYTPAVGDVVSVSGAITSFHGLYEMENVGTTTVLTASKTGTASLPAPSVFTTTGLTNGSPTGLAQQSTLGTLSGVTFTGFTGTTFTSGGTYTVTNAAGSAIVYVGSGSPLIGQTIPTGPASVFGYLGQYDTNATAFGPGAASTSGYELDPLTVAAAAPEPSSVAGMVIGVGALGLLAARRRFTTK